MRPEDAERNQREKSLTKPKPTKIKTTKQIDRVRQADHIGQPHHRDRRKIPAKAENKSSRISFVQPLH